MSETTPEATVADPIRTTVDISLTVEERLTALEAIVNTPVFSRGNESATEMAAMHVPYAGEAV